MATISLDIQYAMPEILSPSLILLWSAMSADDC